jgi:hypothetical protein
MEIQEKKALKGLRGMKGSEAFQAKKEQWGTLEIKAIKE